jgi:hypothetical protein
MVYRLLYDLPADRTYRVLFMRRKLEEVLASQRAMLKRNGADGDEISDEQMSKLFYSELNAFYDWAAKQPHLHLINVDYNRMQSDPRSELARVSEFLDGGIDVDAMLTVIDSSLYRNRR